MTSSPPPDDASGHSRRRRAVRSPEEPDSSWADVVGLRGTWQDEAEADGPAGAGAGGGFDAFGAGSPGGPATGQGAGTTGAGTTGAGTTGPGAAGTTGATRSDRRSGRREQPVDQKPGANTTPTGAPASVNANPPWWAGAGGAESGGASQPSSPFQPGGAMTGGAMNGIVGGVWTPGPAGHQANQGTQGNQANQGNQGNQATRGGRSEPAVRAPAPQLPIPPMPLPPPAGGSMFEPARQDRPPSQERPGYRPPAYEPPAYTSPHEPPVYEPPPFQQRPAQPAAYEPAAYEPPAPSRTAYEASPYDPSGYETPPFGQQTYPEYPPSLDAPSDRPGTPVRPSPPAPTAPEVEQIAPRMPAPWDSASFALPPLHEFTTSLPAVPATPAPIIPAVPAVPAENPTAPTPAAPTPAAPTPARTSAAGTPAGGAEPAADPDKPTSGDPIGEQTGEQGLSAHSFNDVLTGSIPQVGQGARSRGAGRGKGARGKGAARRPLSPGPIAPALPPVPVMPAAAVPPAFTRRPRGSRSSGSSSDGGSAEVREQLDDDTTVFPGLGSGAGDPRDDEGTRTLPRTAPGPRGPDPDLSDLDDESEHEGPSRAAHNMLLPGVPGPAPSPGRAGRNLPAAIAVGVGLGAIAAVSLFTRPEAFVAVVSIVAVLAVWELAGAMAAKDIMVPVVPLAVGSLGMLVSAFVAGEEGLLVSFTLTGFGVLLWRIIDGVEGAARDITAGLFVAAYVPLLAGFAILMLADGPKYVVVFILATVASDIGGYAAGVLAGKTPMAPTVSPKKTWEGFAGSVLACLAVGTVSVVLLLNGPPLAGLALGAAAVVTATLGDLAESLLKRDLNVKDMGNLLPGHGGLMDRLDSLLPTAPVAFLILHTLVATR